MENSVKSLGKKSENEPHGRRKRAGDTSAGIEPMLGPLREACRLDAFSAGPIVVAVSGGADSVGLLHALVHGDVLPRLRPEGSRTIVVAHAEHDLRDAAPLDRDFVAALARSLGLPFVTRRIACRGEAAGTGEGIEAAARRLRYAFLAEAAGEAGGRAVVVAHTADDQVETILHAVLRGTGLAGLAGMPEARELVEGIALVRPLLGIERSAVRGYLTAVGQPWREDPSNAEQRFARNFLRHSLLPDAVEGPYPAAQASIRRLGHQAAGLSRAVASAAELLLEGHSRREADGTIVVDPRKLASLDPWMLGEVFVHLWKREGWPRRDMTARHYRSLAAIVCSAACKGNPRSALDLPGGIHARMAADGTFTIRCVPPDAAALP